jgi:homoserine trans-succinylase
LKKSLEMLKVTFYICWICSAAIVTFYETITKKNNH